MDERYYQCTCCGMKETEPGRKCACSDEKCPVCPRCTFCCKAPGTHGTIRPLRRAFIPPVITGHDHEWLAGLKVSWEGDNRPEQRMAA